jgi:hypothetical protein
LLVPEAALGGLPAAATGGPSQTAPPTLEGLEDEGLVRFDDPRKALWLVVIERGEKSMSPPEGGARVDPASLGRLGEAFALDEGSPLIEPAVRVVQAGDRARRERIEGLATLSAAVARQAPRAAPPSNLGAAAVRAAVSGETDFGDVRKHRAPRAAAGPFRASPSTIVGGAKALSLSSAPSCETSGASASASSGNATRRCAAVSRSTAESHASKFERSVVSHFNQVEVPRTFANCNTIRDKRELKNALPQRAAKGSIPIPAHQDPSP